MKENQKSFLTPLWIEIKEFYEKNTNKNPEYGKNFPIDGELDQKSGEFVQFLGEFTRRKGYDCIIEGVKMDLWKERIWSLIENAGLLAPISWKLDEEEEMEEQLEKNWYNDLEDFEFEVENDDEVQEFVKNHEIN